jgi:hypothetical protein
MKPIIFIAALPVLLIAIGFIVFFVQRRSIASNSHPSPTMQSEDMAAPSQSQLNTPAPPPPAPLSSKPNGGSLQQPVYDLDYSSSPNAGANQSTRNTRFNESSADQHYMQNRPTAPVYTSSQYKFVQRTLARGPQNNLTPYNLEQVYERGMQATYDPHLDATHLILTNVVMNTPAEVEIAFRVCTRKIQAVLRSRGKERAALLVDIAGLKIGGEATQVWGQSLKACWDQICSVVGKDQYLAAHYNSKASQPSQEQLQEKIRRIQIMTSAVLNDFQSNIFDTREEAVAFLQRMRQLKAS